MMTTKRRKKSIMMVSKSCMTTMRMPRKVAAQVEELLKRYELEMTSKNVTSTKRKRKKMWRALKSRWLNTTKSSSPTRSRGLRRH